MVEQFASLADFRFGPKAVSPTSSADAVSKLAVLDDGDADVHAIALLELPRCGDAVADHVVGGRAYRLGVAVVADIRWDGLPHRDDVRMAQLVNFVGRDAWSDVLGNHPQYVTRQCPAPLDKATSSAVRMGAVPSLMPA